MKVQLFQGTSRWIGALLLGIMIGAGVGIVQAWTSPSVAPPGGNLPGPVNIGASTQTKSGGLNISGNVGVGNASPTEKLDVTGRAVFDYVIADPTDGLNEGGEMLFRGAGSNAPFYIDNFQGNPRIHGIAAGKSLWIHGGNGIDVVDGKVRSLSTIATDPGNTLVTKDYLDAAMYTGYTRGAHYGHCWISYDANWNPNGSSADTWPMTTCSHSPVANATCAPGFTVVLTGNVQMNGSGNGLGWNGLSRYDDTQDVYYNFFDCVKN